MSKSAIKITNERIIANLVLRALIVVYAAARVLQMFPYRVPMLAIVALHVLSPAFFALIHGAILYKVRGILTFVAICLVIGNILENLSVLTGFPFGHYYFTDVMGPKIFHVPILLGLAYVGMGYLSWALGNVILGSARNPLAGSSVMTLPLVASFIMVAWDLSMDPVWATLVHAWIWVEGGAYFGVPLSNFLGWYLTVYVIYQLFALYLRGHLTDANPLPLRYWHPAVVLYGVSAAGNILLRIPRTGNLVVADPTGRLWKVSDITGACALISIFVMGSFALLAFAKLIGQNSETTDCSDGGVT